MSSRVTAKARDTYEEHTITEVTPHGDSGWSILMNDGMGFSVPADSPIEPEIGMTARLYPGRTGLPVRGLDLNGIEVFYRTEEEERERHETWVAEQRAKRREELEATREDRDAKIATLPDPLRERMEGFHERGGDEWRAEYEEYELSICVDAAKVAAALPDADAVRAFHEKGYEQQREIVPDTSDGHSGNSWGMVIRLAHLMHSNPSLVPKEHGGICPLVGCENCCCWSTTQTPEPDHD